MRIYLDNCCLNRPFDDQKQIRIRLETESKLYIQEQILNERIELVWSYILDYENSVNPFRERKRAIAEWKNKAQIEILEEFEVIESAKSIEKFGLKAKDALHIACAIAGNCSHFLTTDDAIISRSQMIKGITILNPISFIKEIDL